MCTCLCLHSWILEEGGGIEVIVDNIRSLQMCHSCYNWHSFPDQGILGRHIFKRSPFLQSTSAFQNALLESKVNPRSLFQCSFLYTKSYFQENSCYGSLVFNLSYNIQVYCVRRSRTVLSFSHKPVIAFDLVTCIRLTFILQLHSKPCTLVSCSLQRTLTIFTSGTGKGN